MQKHLQHQVFKKISEVAAIQNVKVFVIGGFVRDLILERKSNDIDIVVLGNGVSFAEEVARVLKTKVTIFKNFGTASLHYQTLDIEFVGARKESYRAESRKPVVENGTLEDDQNRRDLTINAMAISLNPADFGSLIDPFNGLDDIDKRLIRTPLDPDITFSDDPLRMMRAIRFAAQLDFEIDHETFESISKNRDRIKIVSQERITDEINKIIATKKPSSGFILLFKSGLLELIFKQLHQLHGIDYVDGKGHKDNFYHTMQVLDNVAEKTDNIWLRWAAVLHDIAKPATKRFEPGHGWTFHGHEDRGARMVPKIFSQLKLPLNDQLKMVQKLVQLHMRPIVLAQEKVTDSALRRLLFDAGEEIDQLMILCNADITTKNEYKITRYRNNFELVKQKLKDVEERDQLRNWQPPLTGDDIMQTFDIKAGREVGLIKNGIREAILEGQISNSRPEAIGLMIKLGEDIGLKVACKIST